MRLSEECCIRKAVNERGLNSGPVGLADATSEDEAAMGTAFASMTRQRAKSSAKNVTP